MRKAVNSWEVNLYVFDPFLALSELNAGTGNNAGQKSASKTGWMTEMEFIIARMSGITQLHVHWDGALKVFSLVVPDAEYSVEPTCRCSVCISYDGVAVSKSVCEADAFKAASKATNSGGVSASAGGASGASANGAAASKATNAGGASASTGGAPKASVSAGGASTTKARPVSTIVCQHCTRFLSAPMCQCGKVTTGLVATNTICGTCSKYIVAQMCLCKDTSEPVCKFCHKATHPVIVGEPQCKCEKKQTTIPLYYHPQHGRDVPRNATS